MGTSFFTVIEQHYSSFSKQFKAIADYVIANYKAVSFLSVHKLSAEIGVSTASIVRFCQKIGYSGYSEFQRDAQLLVQGETPPMFEFRSAISNIENDTLKEILRINVEALKKTYTDLLAGEFKKAVDTIHNAKKVYVVGMRSTYTMAYYMSFMLMQFMDNVELITAGTNDVYDRLSHAGPEDAALVFSFSRYTQLTVEVTEFLREKSVSIIGVTDAQSSPIATRSTIMLLAKTSSQNYSFVSAMTVADALVVALGKKNKELTLQRLREKEVINRKNGIYFNQGGPR